MKLVLGSIRYGLLPEYSERSQLTDLFLENKLYGWLGLLSIFILICLILYFQLKIWENEDKLSSKKMNEWKANLIRDKKKAR